MGSVKFMMICPEAKHFVFSSNVFYNIKYREDDLYFSMALDEALFTTSISENINLIRLYRINDKSFSAGYFSSAKKINKACKWTRRITGGGIVEHDGDLVVLLTFKSAERSIIHIYEYIHRAIFSYLHSINSQVKILQNTLKKGEMCFQNPVKSDLMIKEEKIAGGALKKRKDFFLYQGSIKLKYFNIENFDVVKMAEQLKLKIRETKDYKCFVNRENLSVIQEKYSSDEWRFLR